jgi:hypothetical protein
MTVYYEGKPAGDITPTAVVDLSAPSRCRRDLCIMACAFCRDPLFWRWIYSLGLGQVGVRSGEFNEAGAKAFILSLCKVESRNELDTNPEAAQRFHQLIRQPFLQWKEEQHGQ